MNSVPKKLHSGLQWLCMILVGFATLALLLKMHYMEETKISPWYFSRRAFNQNIPIQANININNLSTESSLVTNPARSVHLSMLNTSFDIHHRDHVIVFLHIQKTGGTIIGKHLIHDLDLELRCTKESKKRYNCLKPNSGTHWLFSRYTTGKFCMYMR